jgi:general secretion pathway protein G
METRFRRRHRNGFTLLELLVVLVILGLLVGIVAPAAIKFLSKAKSDVARIQLQSISTSLDMFHIDIGRYPTDEENLQALIRRPAGVERWKGPYLNGNEIPKDPWDRPYVYERPAGGGAFRLLSLGADGVEGGEGENADIPAK